MVGHLAGHEELPVNFQNSVGFNRIRRWVNLDVLSRVVGRREHVAVLPGKNGPIGRTPRRHQREFSTDHGIGILTDHVLRNHLVGIDALVENFTFRNGQIEVHRLHRVGNLKRDDGQFSCGFRGQRNRDVNPSRAGVGNGIVEFVDQRVTRLLARDGDWTDESTGSGGTFPCRFAVDVQPRLIGSVGMQSDGQVRN